MKKLLKIYSLFRTAIYSLLLLSSGINARYLPGDWQPAPQLGNGYNSITHEVTSCNCVDAPEVKVGKSEETVKYTNDAKMERIAAAFSGSISMSLDVPFTKASAGMSYARDNAATEQRMNWFYEFESTPKSIALEIKNLTLSETGREAIEEGAEAVSDMCGDEYIYQIDLGAKLVVTMSVEFASSEDRSAFKSVFSIDVDYKAASATAKGDLSSVSNRIGSRTNIKVDAIQIGGDSGALAGIIDESVVECSLSNIDKCLETFKKVLAYAKTLPTQLAKGDGFSVVGYHTKEYRGSRARKLVPSGGFPMLDTMVKIKRNKIQKQYEKEYLAYGRANYIENKLSHFVSHEQMTKITDIYQKSFNNMNKLTEAMELCLRHPNKLCTEQQEDLEKYDVKDLEVKVSKQVDPNTALGKLLKAVKDNNTAEVHDLIKENGATLISKNDPWGYSSFHRAIEHAHHDMVDLLIRKGPQKNPKSSETDQVTTGLVDIPCDDKDEYTPLCLAAKGGTHDHILCMNLLCVAGADIDCTTQSGLTPLQVAVMHGQLKTVRELILRGADKQILDKHGSTLLHLGAEVGDEALINYLIDDAKLAIDAQDKKGLTPLHKAVHANKTSSVETLLLKGSNLHLLDNQQDTALHWGVKNEEVALKWLEYYKARVKLSVAELRGFIDGKTAPEIIYKTAELERFSQALKIHQDLMKQSKK